jgi:hypothetical protein
VEGHLGESGLRAAPEQLELKGIEGPQPAYRIAAVSELSASGV